MQQPQLPVQQPELPVQRPEAPDLYQALEVTNAWVLLLHESVDQLNERTRAIETLLRQVLDERRRPDVAARGTYFPSPLPPNAG